MTTLSQNERGNYFFQIQKKAFQLTAFDQASEKEKKETRPSIYIYIYAYHDMFSLDGAKHNERKMTDGTKRTRARERKSSAGMQQRASILVLISSG